MQKGGGTQAIFMYYWMTSFYYGLTTGQHSHIVIFIPCWYTKDVTLYTVVKLGGGMGQGPPTEVTHLRLNQPMVYSHSMLWQLDMWLSLLLY